MMEECELDKEGLKRDGNEWDRKSEKKTGEEHKGR